MLRKAKSFIVKYERRLSSIAMIAGFIFDNLAFKRVDLLLENIFIVAHIVIVAIAIVYLNLVDINKPGKVFWRRLHPFFLITFQFMMGGIFNVFLVFYSRSTTFPENWPFLLVLAGSLIGNEFLRKHYTRLALQIGLLYLATFSYLIFLIPLWIKQIGPWPFILSGVASLFVIYTFVFSLKLLVRDRIVAHRRALHTTVLSVFLVINILYFSNMIPPIPLSVKDSGIYHSIVKNADGNYTATSEEFNGLSWFNWYPTIHVGPNNTVYFFTAIFAPTKFSLNIIHDWEYYDVTNKTWQEFNSVPLSISGGREGGFRTYSQLAGLSPGFWRVTIKTENGQIIGRDKFRIASPETALPLLIEKSL